MEGFDLGKVVGEGFFPERFDLGKGVEVEFVRGPPKKKASRMA